MVEPINEATIAGVENTQFREYARIYLNIEQDFYNQIVSYGLPFSEEEHLKVDNNLVDVLSCKGLVLSNDRRSLHSGWISPSCIACRKGVGTVTFLISVQCQKNCFFCFNSNQVDYGYLLTNTKDVAGELCAYYDQGVAFTDIALTGGEPLIHKEKTLEFFRETQKCYPKAYRRLYTNGVYLDANTLDGLKKAGLDEIRFSVKTDESGQEQEHTLKRIKLAKKYIPFVIVEMPVMPDEYDLMTRLLVCLDSIGVDGINLLELCFPLGNSKDFLRRGFLIKKKPFRVLYNYWYAGGLPIAKSEEICLRLLEFSLDSKLLMGVHYCSLENKFTGQIFLQNYPYRNKFPTCIMSERDHFFKAAKVFGKDALLLQSYFNEKGLRNYRLDTNYNCLEFPLSYMGDLKAFFGNMEVGISYYVAEDVNGRSTLKELRIDRSTPCLFDEKDI